MYVLKLEASGVACEVSVNDVPLANVTGMGASNRLAFAAPWITEAVGMISARILPSAIPPERPVERSAHAVLIALPPGAPSGEPDGEVIAEIRWLAAPGDETEVLPLQREARFSARPAPPMRWQRSRLSAGTPADAVALFGWISGLQAAVERGDVAHFVKASEPGLRDLAEAMGLDPQEQIEELTELLSLNFPVTGLRPLAPEDLAYRPVAGGRLLSVTRKNGDPVISTLPGAERPYRYNLRAGMVDGQWWAF
ncbi:MAG: hypothetical protein B7Y36_10415 [Novosphingobium sp. 28-62-57]|nr:MAG: hypothetical protein B7Z34_12835 [Novosphingobium sp. 12-62-10]OYZ10161.1 MAG: hypothetical protein B7Y36_10415 [Novosphingobium sp. 28-62-57]OZA38107.1 MAG: hypothetical protein B7X92_03890 [Novosphingobium sp. 17-62-9]